MRNILTFAIGGAFLAAGCGAPTLSREEAWQALQATTSAGQSLGQSPSAYDGVGGATASVNYTVSCPEGGTAAASGTFDGEAAADGGDYTIEVDATYSACTVGDQSLDGTLSIDLSGTYSVAGQDTSGDFDGHVVGSLTFGGEIEGSCSFDYGYSLTYSTTASSYEYDYSFSGTFCGYDLEELQADFSASGSAD